MTLPFFPRLPNYFPWNHELDTQLRELWLLGLSYREIAERLGCSPHTIQRRSCRLDLARRSSPDNWPESKINQLTELWNAGYSAGVIGSIMGVSRNAVLGKRMRLGLAKRRTVTSGTRTPRLRTKTATKPKSATLPVVKAPSILLDMTVLDAANPGIGLMALTTHTCRSVLRSDGAGAFYCGGPVVEGKPYCAGHCALYYVGKTSHGGGFRGRLTARQLGYRA